VDPLITQIEPRHASCHYQASYWEAPWPKKNHRLRWFPTRTFTFMIVLFYLFSVGISRVYRGSHSLNQIILGWVYCMTYTSFIIAHGWDCIKLGLLLHMQLDTMRKRHTAFWYWVAALCITTAMIIGIFQGLYITIPPSSVTLWNTNIQIACGWEKSTIYAPANWYKYLYNLSFFYTNTVAAAFMPWIVFSYQTGGYIEPRTADSWWNLAAWKHVVRFIILIVQLLVAFCPFYFAFKFNPSSSLV